MLSWLYTLSSKNLTPHIWLTSRGFCHNYSILNFSSKNRILQFITRYDDGRFILTGWRQRPLSIPRKHLFEVERIEKLSELVMKLSKRHPTIHSMKLRGFSWTLILFYTVRYRLRALLTTHGPCLSLCSGEMGLILQLWLVQINSMSEIL